MAFWEYILLLEICHKVVENDKKRHISDQDRYKALKKLEDLYRAEKYLTEGDFSERMSGLMENLKNNYQKKFGTGEKMRLSVPKLLDYYTKQTLKLCGSIG